MKKGKDLINYQLKSFIQMPLQQRKVLYFCKMKITA